MFTKLTLSNFKCFEHLELPLAPLTLLTGFNSSGKSSVLQALSLLRQTILANEWSTQLILNGSFVKLGTLRETINKSLGGRVFQIGLGSQSFECIWDFASEERNLNSIPISKLLCKYENKTKKRSFWRSREFIPGSEDLRLHYLLPQELIDASGNARKFSTALSELEYLCAERTGPREAYSIENFAQHPNVGVNGEKTPWVLYEFADKKPLDGLILVDTTPTLQRQTEAWMRRFFPGTRLEITQVPKTNLVTLGLRMSDEEDFHRPQNVGYGLTHILPIITACLSSSIGSILLIENPEAHLHPSGQSLMGQFLGQAVASGLQIIVETHSDHIVNGVRKAVKNQIINHNNVSVQFFSNDKKARVVSLLVDQKGSLDKWPKGFFDQIDIDTSTLIDWDDNGLLPK